MGKFIDLTGQKFGRLTVIKRAENYTPPCGKTQVQWYCKCECGNFCTVSGTHLKTQKVFSCGCYQKEKAKETATHKFTSHGASKESIYKTWINIKSRCFNTHSERYKDHGGRGITMCDRWRNSFEAFYEDVSKLPNYGKEGYSINRIDNDGNYEPNNVEWADDITQANNKRNNRLITFNGKTQTATEWARETGIKRTTITMRLDKYGWSIEKALTTK